MTHRRPCLHCEGWGNLAHYVHRNFEEHMTCPLCEGRGYFPVIEFDVSCVTVTHTKPAPTIPVNETFTIAVDRRLLDEG